MQGSNRTARSGTLMKPRSIHVHMLALALCAGIGGQVSAGTRDALLEHYAAQARAADSGFRGFSATRGETFHSTRHGQGKPDTPACTSCHGEDPRAAGSTRAGKAIDPVAVSAAPSRYADPAKVEKWFARNCNEVLGRACSALEKGDWLAYVTAR